jgi:UDP-glucose 4-epimerase
MKVLVTGATGFVGKAVLAEFVTRGFETVRVGGPQSSGCDYAIDVSDAASVETLSELNDLDAVVHTAGIAHRFDKVSDDEFHRINVDGVKNIAEMAIRLGAKHFVLFSSTLVYGRKSPAASVDEDAECRPLDSYGRSKLDGERSARAACGSRGIALTIFRPGPIIGEGSKGNFAKLIRVIDKRRFFWVGKGTNLKSVVYVGDVARAAATVLESGGNGTQVFNLAADAVRMKDIVEIIAEKLDRNIPLIHLPARPVLIGSKISDRFSRMLDTWLCDDVYSNKKMQDVYGFTPDTPLETAIGREVEYYLKHK